MDDLDVGGRAEGGVDATKATRIYFGAFRRARSPPARAPHSTRRGPRRGDTAHPTTIPARESAHSLRLWRDSHGSARIRPDSRLKRALKFRARERVPALAHSGPPEEDCRAMQRDSCTHSARMENAESPHGEILRSLGAARER